VRRRNERTCSERLWGQLRAGLSVGPVQSGGLVSAESGARSVRAAVAESRLCYFRAPAKPERNRDLGKRTVQAADSDQCVARTDQDDVTRLVDSGDDGHGDPAVGILAPAARQNTHDDPAGLGRVTLHRGRGCASCHLTGMKGRSAIYEALAVTPEIRGLILNHTFAEEIGEVARRQGMKMLREAGLGRVLEGTTTLEEVLRVTTD